MVNFKEIFRKNVTYGNIKSHRKLGLHPPSRKRNFGKTAKGGVGVGHWVNIISRLIAFMSSFVMVASRAFVTTNSYFWFVGSYFTVFGPEIPPYLDTSHVVTPSTL